MLWKISKMTRVPEEPAHLPLSFRAVGISDALHALGHKHVNGIYYNCNVARGIRYFERAVELEHPGATNTLARHYEIGNLVLTRDVEKAHLLYQIAARSGDPVAMVNLARIYAQAGDKEKALMYSRAAKRDSYHGGLDEKDIDDIVSHSQLSSTLPSSKEINRGVGGSTVADALFRRQANEPRVESTPRKISKQIFSEIG